MPISPIPIFKDGNQKIEMYKRFRGVQALEDIEELQEEMGDRFGEYPDEVAYLFQIAEMKVYSVLLVWNLLNKSKHEVTILLVKM